MAIVEFPKGPQIMPAVEEQELEIGTVDVTKPLEIKVNYFYCSDCNGTVFHLYDDGEVECANPRCGGILSGIMVTEIGDKDA